MVFTFQKINVETLKKLNLLKNDDYDKDAVMKYLDNQFKDGTWAKLYKESFENCTKEMEPLLPKIQQRANFTKEICNVKFESVTKCSDICVFAVRLSTISCRKN